MNYAAMTWLWFQSSRRKETSLDGVKGSVVVVSRRRSSIASDERNGYLKSEVNGAVDSRGHW